LDISSDVTPTGLRVPLARIAVARRASRADGASAHRSVTMIIRVAIDALGPTGDAYLTLSIPGGCVVHEGTLRVHEANTVQVQVPEDVSEVHAVLDSGSTYRKAVVRLVEGGVTEYAFR
jgi:hypothetical protein